MTHKQPSCGLSAFIVFVGALVAGTACSLTSKVMLSMKSIGMTGEEENFSFPLFQTFGMFLGMTAGLGLHLIVTTYKIPFPGYTFQNKSGQWVDFDGNESEQPQQLPVWMYFLLAIPSLFDLIATALCMFGLRYVDVSIYQMLRGGAIVFVAILKQFALGHVLRKFQWVGIFWNVMSIVLVGLTAMLSSSAGGGEGGGEFGSGGGNSAGNPIVGVWLILCGAFVQSLQYVFEEKVMNMSIPAPPMLLIGMEGFWGTLLCIFFLYPAAYYLPGVDHGSVENPYNTLVMIQNSSEIQYVFIVYFFSIFIYNVLGVLVTFMLNSVWHAILDNFRPITVWGTDLFIFYVLLGVGQHFGEAWTPYSYIQLLGLFVLLYGTAIYNAPNQGSLLLTGGLSNCYLDFTDEYNEIQEDADFDEGANSHLAFKSPLLTPKAAALSRNPSLPRYQQISNATVINEYSKIAPQGGGSNNNNNNGSSDRYGSHEMTNINNQPGQKIKKQTSFA